MKHFMDNYITVEKIYDFLFVLFSPLCHQIGERSFQDFHGHQFFVCARDSGTYLGFLFSWLVYFFYNKKNFSFPISLVVGLFLFHLVLFGLDGVTSYANLRETTNIIRYFTGFFVGFYLGLIFQYVNYFLFKFEDIKRDFQRLDFVKYFFILEFIGFIMFFLSVLFMKYLLFVLSFAIFFYFYQLISLISSYVLVATSNKVYSYLVFFLGFIFIFSFLFFSGINKIHLIQSIYEHQ